MNENMSENVIPKRVLLTLIGVVAGFAIWFLVDKAPGGVLSNRALLALSTLAIGFFSVLMVSIGPLRLPAALIAASMVGFVSSGLVSTASFRFAQVSDYLDAPPPFFAYFILITVPVPFLFAAFRPGEHWRDYPTLFNHAWHLTVRVLVALTFTALFWGVIVLSDQVLKIVGLKIISELLRIDAVPFMVTGFGLGMGLAVTYELRAYLSPYLVLRLLRLLLPPVLAVSIVFLVAAPIQGLSNLFGGISSAATLMAMVFGAVVLMSTIVDATDKQAASSVILVRASQAMALILPLLAGLAGWAIWLRVSQYGWTPVRLAAATLALVVFAFAVTYFLAVLRGANWRAFIRKSNTGIALLLIGLAVLWLSPILNAQRISANSQVARYDRGEIDFDDLDLWALHKDWGRAGQAVLARLNEQGSPENRARIARMKTMHSRWQWGSTEAQETLIADLDALLGGFPIRPIGAALPLEAFENDNRLTWWLDGCKILTPAGNPGCLALVGDFQPDRPGNEVVVLYLENDFVLVSANASDKGSEFHPNDTGKMWSDPAQIDRILRAGFSIAAAPKGLLLIGESALSVGK